MYFFSWKPFALCVLTLLTLCTMVVLDSGTTPAYAAFHHVPLGASQATTNTPQGAMEAADTVHGCALGYVCLYPQDAGWNGDSPSQTWYYYGSYQLHGQYGTHSIYNNQTGDGPVLLCTDWSGNTCPLYVPAGTGAQTDFTPINSVRLSQSF